MNTLIADVFNSLVSKLKQSFLLGLFSRLDAIVTIIITSLVGGVWMLSLVVMLACVEANNHVAEGDPEVECFCNTATRTVHNQVMCAWNDFNLSDKQLKFLYVQREPKKPNFVEIEDDYE
uniref:Ion_trans domain-containing protein n=1 Tax=Panagrellus redivivus TaxID=6233 RepID=A0A7E4UUQ2_PANRE